MGKPLDRPTRIAADLLDSAAAEGARQSRSAKQQLDHWIRVGRAVTGMHSIARRRVEAAMSGGMNLQELTPEEGVVFNAEIEAELEQRIADTNLGEELRAQGLKIVCLDENNNIIEYPPTGTEPRTEATRVVAVDETGAIVEYPPA